MKTRANWLIWLMLVIMVLTACTGPTPETVATKAPESGGSTSVDPTEAPAAEVGKITIGWIGRRGLRRTGVAALTRNPRLVAVLGVNFYVGGATKHRVVRGRPTKPPVRVPGKPL